MPMATFITCQMSVQQLKTKTDTSMTRHVHKTCLESSTMMSVSTYRKTISSITHCQMHILFDASDTCYSCIGSYPSCHCTAAGYRWRLLSETVNWLFNHRLTVNQYLWLAFQSQTVIEYSWLTFQSETLNQYLWLAIHPETVNNTCDWLSTHSCMLLPMLLLQPRIFFALALSFSFIGLVQGGVVFSSSILMSFFIIWTFLCSTAGWLFSAKV